MAHLTFNTADVLGDTVNAPWSVYLTDLAGEPVLGYLTGDDGVVITPRMGTATAGVIDVDLTPNADITPANTYYTVTVGEFSALITKTSSTQSLLEALASDPTDLGSTGLAAHLADTVDAHDASAISFSPNGSIAATNVQAAIQEVRDEATSGITTASAVSFAPEGSIAATDVQSAIQEVKDDADAVATLLATGITNEAASRADADVTLAGSIDSHVNAASDAHDATAISFTPDGSIAATDVQAAIVEVRDDTDATASLLATAIVNEATSRGDADVTLAGDLSGHFNAAAGAHAATAISFSPTGTIAATDVQAAIAEVAVDDAAAISAAHARLAFFTAR